MANEDLEFTANIRFPDLAAEINRTTQMMQQLARASDLSAPLDRSAAAANRATRAYTQADLSLQNMRARADRAAEQDNKALVRQEAQLQKIEERLRRIAEQPITSPRQLEAVRELEKIQRRLSTNVSAGAPLRPETFAALSTQMNRLVAELGRIEAAQKKIAILDRDLERLQGLAGRGARIDPALVQSLEQFRTALVETGNLSRSTFNALQRGAETAIRTYEQAVRGANAQATAEEELKAAIGRRLAAQERAAASAAQAAVESRRLLDNIAKLPATARRDDLATRVSTTTGGPTQDPRILTALTREYEQLAAAVRVAAAADAEMQAAGQRVVVAEAEMAAALKARENATQAAGRVIVGAEKEMAAEFKRRELAVQQAGQRIVAAEREMAAAIAAKAAAAQRAGQVVVRAEQEMAAEFKRRDAAEEATLNRRQRLLTSISRNLPPSAEKEDLLAKVTATNAETSAKQLNVLTREYGKLAAEVTSTGKAVATATPLVDRLTSRFITHFQILSSVSLAYAGLNVIRTVIGHIVELDAVMHRVSATLDTNEEKARVLPEAYRLINTAMTQFGQSTEDAGKLALELSRSLDGNIDRMRAAYLPALALTTSGEVDMTDAVRTLIGTYNSFGSTLLGVTEPLEGYRAVSDKILRASDLSVGSVGTFSQALTYLAGRAAGANVKLDEQLALLSLIQDSLGRASQSGTGLARVFEGLILNAQNLAKTFNIPFDPAGPVKAIDLLRGVMAELRKEIAAAGGITEQTAEKIQKFVGTEQGTRQIENLVRVFDKFDSRVAAIGSSAGRTQRQLDETNKQLGVSFTNMTNQVLVAIDKILNAVGKMGGMNQDGVPGQFTLIAEVTRNVGNTFEGLGNAADTLGTAIGNLVKNIITLGGVLPNIPNPPAWLMPFLGLGTATAVGFAVAGPPGAMIAAASAGLYQIGANAEASRKQVEALNKSLAGRGELEFQSRTTGQQEIAAENAEQDAAYRAAGLKDRLKKIDLIKEESARETQRNNQELSAATRLKIAQDDLAVSTAKSAAAEKEYAAGYFLGMKDAGEATKELARLEKERASDEAKVHTIRTQIQREALENQKKIEEVEKKQYESLRDLREELSKGLGVTTDPALKALDDSDRAYAAKKGDLAKKNTKDFADNNRDLIRSITNLDLTAAQQALLDGLTKPYRDAHEIALNELDAMIAATDSALRNVKLISPEFRKEIAAAPDKKVDQMLGVDKLRNQLREAEAVFGKFGAAAEKELFAAKQGMTSYAEAVKVADNLTREFGATGLSLLIKGFERVQSLTVALKLAETAQALAQAQRDLGIAAGQTGIDPAKIAANTAALDMFRETIDELATSSDASKRQIAAMLVEIARTSIATAAIKDLNPQILTMQRAFGGTEAAMAQLGEEAIVTKAAFATFGPEIDKNSEAWQKWIVVIRQYAAEVQKAKEQTDKLGLQTIGFSPQTATEMAHTLAIQDEQSKKIQDGIDALTRYNALAERTAQQQLENIRQTARASGDVFTFFEVSFAQAATQGHTFWDDMSTLAKNTAQNMASSMSDIFFALVNNKLEDAKAAFKNFFQGLLREMTNFLSTQTVAAFANLFSSPGDNKAGGATGLASLFKGSGGGGGSPTATGIGADAVAAAAAAPEWALNASRAADSLGNLGTAAGVASNGISTLAAVWSGVTNGVAAFGEAIDAGFGVVQAASDAWATFGTAMSGAVSAATVAFAGVGAAVAAFGSVMDIVGGKVEKGVGGLVGGAIGATGGAILGSFIGMPWLGGFIGYMLGDLLGSFLGDLFGGISNYEEKRAKAADEATDALGTLSKAMREAAASTDPAKVLAALRMGQGGASNNSVRTELVLTPEMAQRVGIEGETVRRDPTSEGLGRIVAQWVNVSQAQFERLLAEFTKHPEEIAQSIRGSGDVPLLEGKNAEAVADQIKRAATAMLEAFVAFQKVRDQVKKLADDIADALEDFLPPGLADAFEANTLRPLQQKITDLLTSGLPIEDLIAQMNGLQATLKAYIGLINLYGQLTSDFATYTGDFVGSLEYVNKQIDRARATADKRISRGAEAIGLTGEPLDKLLAGELNLDETTAVLQAALDKVDLTPELLFEGLVELRTAVIDRYDLERKLVLETEDKIKQLYETHNVGILSMAQTLGYLQVQLNGSEAYFDAVITALGNFATQSQSVAEALFNAGAVLKFTIDSMPTRIAGQGGEGAGGLGLTDIFPAVLEGLNPFIASLNTQISAAIGAGDFEGAMTLMTQLGQGLQAAMNAAIAGVKQWETLQVDAINKDADKRIKTIEDTRDAAIAAIKPQRDAIDGYLDAIKEQKYQIGLMKWAIEDAINAIQDQVKPLQAQLDALTDAQEAIRRNQIRPLERAIRYIGDLMEPLEDELEALNKQAAALQRAADIQLRGINLQIKALDRQAELLRRNADAQLWTIKLQQDSLNETRDALEEHIALIEDWANAVESIRKYIHELALSQQAPPDALGQYHLAQQTFDRIFADFETKPTAKGLGKVEESAANLLTSMEALFGRSSIEYRTAYDAIVRRLEAAGATGAEFGDPATLDDLKDQLASVDKQLASLDKQAEAINRTLELQLHEIEGQTQALHDQADAISDPLEEQLFQLKQQTDGIESLLDAGKDAQKSLERQVEQLDRQIELIEDQKGPIQDAIDWLDKQAVVLQAQLDALGRHETILSRQETSLNRDLGRIGDAEDLINTNAGIQIKAVNDARTAQIDAVHLAAQAQIAFIQAQMLPILGTQQRAATDLFTFMRDNHYQRLMDLTSGQGAAAWLKTAQENTAAWIGAIMNMLSLFLSGDMKTITTAITAPEDPDTMLINTLTNVDITLGNLDQTLQAVNAKLGGVGYAPPEPGPSAQHGDWYTHTGMYKLHEGELVPPRGAAEAIRRNASSWDDLTRRLDGGGNAPSLTIEAGAINIASSQPPPAIAAAIVDIIERDIRGNGRIRAAIQKVH